MRANDKLSRVDFYPDDWLAGTIGLSLEERGAYITLCALIYSTGAALRDDERVLARQLGISSRRWRLLRQALLDKRKIEAADGLLDNRRCRFELESTMNRLRIARESGSVGGRKSAELRAKSLTNKDTSPREPQGTLQGGLNLPSPSPTSVSKDTAAQELPAEAQQDFPTNGTEVIDLGKVIFGPCLGYLRANGVADKNARSLLGSWRKQHGAGAVIDAVAEAQRQAVSEPVSWITAALAKRLAHPQGPAAKPWVQRRRDMEVI
jgi:uncharacterized protein YdaU (DUF1376 family)